MKPIVFAAFALSVAAVAQGVLLEPKPFKRLIPADRLRDFRGQCFASTLCKVIEPGQSWSLKPFCGKSTCRAVKTGEGEAARTVLAEEVIDCGPLVDFEKTKGCKLLPVEEGATEAEFPDCCPKVDCEEGAEVKYVGTAEEEPRSLGAKSDDA